MCVGKSHSSKDLSILQKTNFSRNCYKVVVESRLFDCNLTFWIRLHSRTYVVLCEKVPNVISIIAGLVHFSPRVFVQSVQIFWYLNIISLYISLYLYFSLSLFLFMFLSLSLSPYISLFLSISPPLFHSLPISFSVVNQTNILNLLYSNSRVFYTIIRNK